MELVKICDLFVVVATARTHDDLEAVSSSGARGAVAYYSFVILSIRLLY